MRISNSQLALLLSLPDEQIRAELLSLISNTLSERQREILAIVLASSEPMLAKEVAQRCQIKPDRASTLLLQLVELGQLERYLAVDAYGQFYLYAKPGGFADV